MKICFILNNFYFQPTGGVKIIFEYANRLSQRGNTVQILYINRDEWKRFHLPEKTRQWLVSRSFFGHPSWFHLEKNIQVLSYYDNNLQDKTRDTDVFIATAVTTVNITKKIFKDRKYAYFIQDYENWNVSDKYCQKTYSAGMTNIVISQWLKDIVDKYACTPSVLIKDPIDLNNYTINTSPNERKLHSIGILYHTMPHKGLKYSLAAAWKLKEQYPDLEIYMFGVPDRPKDFPSWIHYTKKASQQQTVEIYNKVSVWLCATVDEGFGLTGLEAMACGDVLVSTAYTGVFEYAKDGYNALLSPVKDVDALVRNVEKVFENANLRDKLVRNAQKSVKEFSWDIALNKFEHTLETI